MSTSLSEGMSLPLSAERDPVLYLTDVYPDTVFVRSDVARLGMMQMAPGQGVYGYGRKISTDYMATFNGRKHRVYCCCFSNAGTCYVLSGGKWLVVKDGDIPDSVRV